MINNDIIKNKTMRNSPNLRSRNNEKVVFEKINQSQANIDLSTMNDEEETKFQSSINKYQKDSQKKYMPYG